MCKMYDMDGTVLLCLRYNVSGLGLSFTGPSLLSGVAAGGSAFSLISPIQSRAETCPCICDTGTVVCTVCLTHQGQ